MTQLKEKNKENDQGLVTCTSTLSEALPLLPLIRGDKEAQSKTYSLRAGPINSERQSQKPIDVLRCRWVYENSVFLMG